MAPIYRNWSTDLIIRNALNEDYIEAVSSRTSVRPGAPASFLARLRYRF